MRITFYFDRNKPFARISDRGEQTMLVERYTSALADAFSECYPGSEIVVVVIDEPSGDVEFVPEDALAESERLAIAVEMKRIAHRIGDEVLAAHLRELGEASR